MFVKQYFLTLLKIVLMILPITLLASQYDTELLQLTNAERQAAGLSPLRLSAQLGQAAQAHAEDMANNNYFSHTGLNGSQSWDRVNLTGYVWSYVGENIAVGRPTPAETIEQWMNSPGHRANILNANYTEIGFGYAYLATNDYGHYWVQVFGTPQGGGSSEPTTPVEPPVTTPVTPTNPTSANHWITSKSQALSQAVQTGKKYVILVACGNREYIYDSFFTSATAQNLIQQHFVLWFSIANGDDPEFTGDYNQYVSDLWGTPDFGFPMVVVIDPTTDQALEGYRFGSVKNTDQDIIPHLQKLVGADQPVTTPTNPPVTTPTDSPIVAGQYDAELLQLTNAQRQAVGLSPLRLSTQLGQAAQAHAEDMANNNYFSHTGLNGSQPWDRVSLTGYVWSTVGENIAAGRPTPAETIEQWMNSQGHRENILNADYTEIGFGYTYLATNDYGHYWVQVFGTPQGGSSEPTTPVEPPVTTPTNPEPPVITEETPLDSELFSLGTAKAINTAGFTSSDTQFSGNLFVADMNPSPIQFISSQQSVGIKVSIQVDPSDVGKMADILFVVGLEPFSLNTSYTGDEDTSYITVTAEGNSLPVDLYAAPDIWMPQLSEPYQSSVLLENQLTLDLGEWLFSSLGMRYLFVGYRLPDGTIIYTAQPLMVEVTG